MKRIKAEVLIICMSLMVTSFAACNSRSTGETINVRNKDVKETTEDTTTIETTAETTAEETTESTTKMTEETTTVSPADLSNGDSRYEMYMGFCENHNEIDPDYLFGFSNNYGVAPLTFNVMMYDPDFKTLTTYFYNEEGSFDLVASETIGDNQEYKIEHLLSYDDLCKLPCMISEDDFWEPMVFADKLDDGRYFGDAIAFSNDGTKAFLLLGKGIIYTEEEFNKLKVGDKIKIDYYGTEYATVTEVNDSEYDYEKVILDCDLWFEQGSYTENETDYILMSDSSNPVYTDAKLVTLDLAPDADVTDTYRWLMGDNFEDAKIQFVEDNGYENTLQVTDFWYYNAINEYRRESSNGWTPMFGLVYPVVIENGVISSINLEWR